MTKTYADLTPADLEAIAHSWNGVVTHQNGAGGFARHVHIWLAEHGFAWDPEVDDDENQALFDEIVAAAWGWNR